jgi:NAD(P)-dependent dehydrogenase (short-subunit alcohol dehydrogenase family)
MSVPSTRRLVVVTGGTTGIGFAIAQRFAHDGFAVLITGRDAAKGAAAVSELGARGHVRFVAADVADHSGRAMVVDHATSSGLPVAALINNAGTWDNAPIDAVTEESWNRTFAVNVTGVFFMTQAILPLLLAGGNGRVVNIASIAGLHGFADTAAYCATKGAVIALTKSLAVELGPVGVGVNAVAPGNVLTPFNEHLMVMPGYADRLIERTPARRNGNPDDIAGAVAFLVSSDADWMHGECIVVDGGWMAA